MINPGSVESTGDIATEAKQEELVVAIEALTVELKINNAILNEVHDLNITEKDVSRK